MDTSSPGRNPGPAFQVIGSRGNYDLTNLYIRLSGRCRSAEGSNNTSQTVDTWSMVRRCSCRCTDSTGTATGRGLFKLPQNIILLGPPAAFHHGLRILGAWRISRSHRLRVACARYRRQVQPGFDGGLGGDQNLPVRAAFVELQDLGYTRSHSELTPAAGSAPGGPAVPTVATYRCSNVSCDCGGSACLPPWPWHSRDATTGSSTGPDSRQKLQLTLRQLPVARVPHRRGVAVVLGRSISFYDPRMPKSKRPGVDAAAPSASPCAPGAIARGWGVGAGGPSPRRPAPDDLGCRGYQIVRYSEGSVRSARVPSAWRTAPSACCSWQEADSFLPERDALSARISTSQGKAETREVQPVLSKSFLHGRGENVPGSP